MTSKSIHLFKQAFPSAIHRTFCAAFYQIQLTACSRGPSATAGLLVISALILTAVHNFLATIWPLVEITRSLVVYVNHHNKDYLRKTPCDWLCGDDAAIVKLL